jgi:hypothetical protein
MVPAISIWRLHTGCDESGEGYSVFSPVLETVCVLVGIFCRGGPVPVWPPGPLAGLYEVIFED